MIQIELSNEKMKEWFPKTYKSFLKDYKNSKRKFTPKPEEEIEWMVSYAFYVTKAKNEEDAIQNQINYENKLKLTYDERCKADLPKLKINCYMSAGYYTRSDRSHDKKVPQYITDLFYEVMKITMLQEQIYLNDPVVMKSLEGFQHLLDEIIEDMGIEMEGIEELTKKHEETPLDLDGILDKISSSGVQSLSARELKFLDKKSRG